MAFYDPVGDETLTDPFPAYERLRAECPVHHHGSFTPPFFTVTRHDDVVEVLRDVETWSMKYGPSPDIITSTEVYKNVPVFSRDPKISLEVLKKALLR